MLIVVDVFKVPSGIRKHKNVNTNAKMVYYKLTMMVAAHAFVKKNMDGINIINNVSMTVKIMVENIVLV